MKQEMMGWKWNQLDDMQIICTSLQSYGHASTLHSIFYRPDALPAVKPSIEGIKSNNKNINNNNSNYNKWSR